MASRCMDAIVKGIPAAKVGIPFSYFLCFGKRPDCFMPQNVIELVCHNKPTGRTPMLLPKGSFFST